MKTNKSILFVTILLLSFNQDVLAQKSKTKQPPKKKDSTEMEDSGPFHPCKDEDDMDPLCFDSFDRNVENSPRSDNDEKKEVSQKKKPNQQKPNRGRAE